MTTNRRFAERRDRYLTGVLRDSAVRAFYEEMRYRPPHVYMSGLLVSSRDTDGPAGVMIGQPRAFSTAAGRTMLLDEAVGPGWRLFGVGVAQADLDAARQTCGATAARCGTRVHRRATAERQHRLPRRRRRASRRRVRRLRGQFLLVRPDHFVAVAWRPTVPLRSTGCRSPRHPSRSSARTPADPCHAHEMRRPTPPVGEEHH